MCLKKWLELAAFIYMHTWENRCQVKKIKKQLWKMMGKVICFSDLLILLYWSSGGHCCQWHLHLWTEGGVWPWDEGIHLLLENVSSLSSPSSQFVTEEYWFPRAFVRSSFCFLQNVSAWETSVRLHRGLTNNNWPAVLGWKQISSNEGGESRTRLSWLYFMTQACPRLARAQRGQKPSLSNGNTVVRC